MKNMFNREWLENYKIIPKKDNTIYKNYQNPGMSAWDRQFGSLSPAQKGRYNEFLNTIPDELKGLSAAEMQKYLQGVDEKQKALAQERAGYEGQIQNIRNQEAQKLAAEAQRQAQLRAQQEEAKNLTRPMTTHMGGFSGSFSKQARYTDNGQVIPFNILLKKLARGEGYPSLEGYAGYYYGHEKSDDPRRPYEYYHNPKSNGWQARYKAPSRQSQEVPMHILEQIALEKDKNFNLNAGRSIYNFPHWTPPNDV